MAVYVNLGLILILSFGMFAYLTYRLRANRPWTNRAYGIGALLTATGALSLYLFLGAPEVPTAYRYANPGQAQENALKVQKIFLETQAHGPVTANNVTLYLMLLDTYRRLNLTDKAQELEKQLGDHLRSDGQAP